MNKALRDQIIELVHRYSFFKGKITLTSGKESDYYIDGKQTMLRGECIDVIARFILDYIKGKHPQVKAVGGMAMGAVPMASAVSALSRTNGSAPLASFFVRPKAKEHGTRSQVEHPGLPPGTPVLIVEDVITTGGSSLRAIKAAREEGWQVEGVLVLVDRQEGGREAIEKESCPVDAVMTRDDLFAWEEGENNG